MASKGKTSQQKPAGGQKISAGPSGKMAKFKGVGTQKAGVSAVDASSGGGKFAKGGPSGKMTGNMTVGAKKPGVSEQNNSIGRSSYAKG